MAETTRLDRFVIWIKNNKVLAVILLMAISVMAVSQFVQSVVSLVRAGRELVSSGHTDDAESPFLGALAPSRPAATITFSGKGTGPGLFTDARNIAVDQRGQVFVVEWNRGRVQRFEADGKFVGQWSITPWAEYDSVKGISIDMNGVLYVAHQKDIWRYDGDTGKLLGKLTFPKEGLEDVLDVKVIPGGGLTMSSEAGFDNRLVILDAALRVRRTLTNPLSSHREGLADPDPTPEKLAVDGLGNIYVTASVAVFKFSSDGTFLNRFGSDGVEPGQLHNIQAIAANGKGDVFVSDVSGIQVFDGTGRFLRRIEMHDSWAMGMAFNNSGQLYAITDNAVMRFDSP